MTRKERKMPREIFCRFLPVGIFLQVLLLNVSLSQGELILGPEQLVQGDNVSIDVPGYSVPSFVDWNNDGKKDLIVGEGSGTDTPKVRVYLNVGTASAPQFSTYFYAQSNGSDLTVLGGGCLGLFPRVVYWDADSNKDLLIGLADGTVKIYLNTGNDTEPTFDAGQFLQVGAPGSKTNINVIARATPIAVDWNSDGKKDLVVGDFIGQINVFVNEGTDTEPDFLTVKSLREGDDDLIVPEGRSSPVVLDVDGDQKNDLLTGNTAGQLIFYSNTGTAALPMFSDHSFVEANGVPIDLPDSARSRPSACDWTDDGLLDVLIGGSDGLVRLYQHAFCGDDQHPYPVADFDQNCIVNWSDFSIFAAHWLESPCPASDYCEGTDLDYSGLVDWGDFAIFAGHWLECTAPGGCN